jgi:hypothetical protein
MPTFKTSEGFGAGAVVVLASGDSGSARGGGGVEVFGERLPDWAGETEAQVNTKHPRTNEIENRESTGLDNMRFLKCEWQDVL